MNEQLTRTSKLADKVAEAVVSSADYDAMMEYYAGHMRPDKEEEFDESLMLIIAHAVERVTERFRTEQAVHTVEIYNEGIADGYDSGYDAGYDAAEAEFNGRTE